MDGWVEGLASGGFMCWWVDGLMYWPVDRWLCGGIDGLMGRWSEVVMVDLWGDKLMNGWVDR